MRSDRSISINAPADESTVNNPFTVSGSVTISPFENTLACRIYLPDGTLVNEAPLMVDSGGEMGGPGTFAREFDLSNAGISGPVIIQFLDLSAADGSILAMASILSECALNPSGLVAPKNDRGDFSGRLFNLSLNPHSGYPAIGGHAQSIPTACRNRSSRKTSSSMTFPFQSGMSRSSRKDSAIPIM